MMKKRILIVVYVLLLCVTTSFAWLSNIQETEVKTVSVDMNNGLINDFSFSASLEMDDSYKVASTDGIKLNNKIMVPGVRIPFKIHIERGTEEKKAKLLLDLDMDCTEAELDTDGIPKIMKKIYVEIVFNEISTDNPGGKTRHIFKKLSELSEIDGYYGDYTIELFGEGEEIIISPAILNEDGSVSAGNDVLTLNCSLYYDQTATAEYQDMGIGAMLFRLER